MRQKVCERAYVSDVPSLWTPPLGAATAHADKKTIDLLKIGNQFLRQYMPSDVKRFIKRLPLSQSQKDMLLEHPLLFWMVIANIADEEMMLFINETQRLSKRPSSKYSIGGVTVDVRPIKGEHYAARAAKFLTVSNKNATLAMKVAVNIAFQRAGQVWSAGASVVAERVAATLKQFPPLPALPGLPTPPKLPPPPKITVPTITMPKVPTVTMPDVTNIWPFAGLGCAEDICIGELILGIGGTAVTAAIAQLPALVGAAVASAPVMVPMLWRMSKGEDPTPPTPSQQQAAAQTVSPNGDAVKAQAQVPPQLNTRAQAESQAIDRAEGRSPVWAKILLGVGAGGGLGYGLYRFIKARMNR